MSDDKKQKGIETSKPKSKFNNTTSQPKNTEFGRIIERNTPSPTGIKKDNSTNSTGPRKPS